MMEVRHACDDNGMYSTVGVAETLSHATHDRFIQSYYYCLNEKVENKMIGCLHGNAVYKRGVAQPEGSQFSF